MICRLPLRKPRGQSLIGAVIIIPVFGVFLLGIFQAILLYRAKSIVDYAALQAARRGATNFANKKAMCKGLAEGLMPLYTHKPTSGEALVGYFKARADSCGPLGSATITIVNPTRAMFEQWKEKQYDGVEAIPNDSLMYRGKEVRAGVTVQDANLLKISVTYKYPLIVPVIDKLIGTRDAKRSLAEGHAVYSLKIQSQATVRMQTPIRDEKLLGIVDEGGGFGRLGGLPVRRYGRALNRAWD